MKPRSVAALLILWTCFVAQRSGFAAEASRVETAPAGASTGENTGWWHAGYLIDYGLMGLGGAAALLTKLADGPSRARLGPVYDPQRPAGIFAPAYAGAIGRSYAEQDQGETVPTAWMGAALGAGFGWLVVQEGAALLTGDTQTPQRLHDTAVGYLEGLSLTLGMNEVLKIGVGRLRPDFQDRARRYHCFAEPVAGLDCAGVQPLDADPAKARWLLEDGRKSFASGHAATAMYLAAYLSFAIGGRYVWGEDATFASRSVGLMAQGMLVSTGVFVLASRYDDGRHALGDVLTGGALGLAFATFSYWRRFDSRGRLRARGATAGSAGRGLTWRLTPGPGLNLGGAGGLGVTRGLGVEGRF